MNRRSFFSFLAVAPLAAPAAIVACAASVEDSTASLDAIRIRAALYQTMIGYGLSTPNEIRALTG